MPMQHLATKETPDVFATEAGLDAELEKSPGDNKFWLRMGVQLRLSLQQLSFLRSRYAHECGTAAAQARSPEERAHLLADWALQREWMEQMTSFQLSMRPHYLQRSECLESERPTVEVRQSRGREEWPVGGGGKYISNM